MTLMSAERLCDLIEKKDGMDALTWNGACHDCGCDVTVSAIPEADGIHVQGGGVYEPVPDAFLVKCDACVQRDPILRNFQHCEVYSRVVGYLRPVAQWNDAKAQEFRDRKTFRIPSNG